MTAGIYAGAALSFAAGLLRDGAASTLPDSGRGFFEVVYLASLASIWGINAIQLGTSPPTRRQVLHIVVLSSAGLALGHALLSPGSPAEVATALAASAMWTVGAVASRAQLARGGAISARAREAVSSVAIAALVFGGCGSMVAIALGVALGTAWMLRVSWDARSRYFSDDASQGTIGTTVRSIVMSNIAVAMVTLWAIHVNRLDGTIMGLPAPWAARASTYVFQAISIGWMVIAVRPDLAPARVARHGVPIALGLFAAAFLCTSWSIAASCVVMPLFAGLGQYTLIAASAGRARRSTV